MQLLVAAGQAKPLQNHQLSASYLLYPQTEYVQVSYWRRRWLSFAFFVQQLNLAVQVYCESEASEVWVWKQYMHADMFGQNRKQNGVCGNDEPVSLLARDFNLLTSYSEYFQKPLI